VKLPCLNTNSIDEPVWRRTSELQSLLCFPCGKGKVTKHSSEDKTIFTHIYQETGRPMSSSCDVGGEVSVLL